MCDKHIPKMVVETAQMLSTIHYKTNTHTPPMYQPTHKHHPATVWCGASKENYRWAFDHLIELCMEFRRRFNKTHKTEGLLKVLDNTPPIPDIPMTEIPQCMPDKFKSSCHVTAYRDYYRGDKRSFAKWDKGRTEPWWWTSPANGDDISIMGF